LGNKMTKLSVSVLMPVYNSALFLAEAIDSILNQTLTNFELIIIDDGSQDNSLKIIKKYAEVDSRIRYLSRDNKGISSTRNQLVAMAQASYIAWMDSDDISLPQRLDVQFKYLSQHTDCVALGCMAEFIDQQGLKICKWKVPTEHEDIDGWHLLGKGGGVVFAASIMLTSAVKQAEGFDESLEGAEDLALFLRLAELGIIENIPESLYIYRQHVNSISHAKKQKIQKDTQQVVSQARLRRGLKPLQLLNAQKESSLSNIYTKWGWWALMDGNIATARKYAWKSVVSSPLKWHSWKLLACSIRGY